MRAVNRPRTRGTGPSAAHHTEGLSQSSYADKSTDADFSREACPYHRQGRLQLPAGIRLERLPEAHPSTSLYGSPIPPTCFHPHANKARNLQGLVSNLIRNFSLRADTLSKRYAKPDFHPCAVIWLSCPRAWTTV